MKLIYKSTVQTLVLTAMAVALALIPLKSGAQENLAAARDITPEAPEASEVPGMPEMAEAPEQPLPTKSFRSPRNQGSELVMFGRDVELKTNETAQVVVVFAGSAKVHGNVNDSIVAIGGNVELSGEAGSVVAIMGSINLLKGGRADETVAVLGNVRVAKGGETGEAVAVGGVVDVAEGGVVRGEKLSLGLPGFATPEWIQIWFTECLLKLRRSLRISAGYGP